MKSRSNAPDGTVTDQSSKAGGEYVAHEGDASVLAKRNHRAHTSRQGGHFASGLLPRSQSNHFFFLWLSRCRLRWRRWSWPRSWIQNLPVVDHESASDDF